MLSKTGIHALTAMAALAELRPGAFAGAADIAREIGAPPNYLGKLLRTLADAGLLESQKGKGGGFRMARDPAKVTLAEVLEPIEHISRWTGCFLGGVRCSDDSACAVHERWKRVRDVYLSFLEETTVADLTNSASRTPAPASKEKP
ncbi:MAG: Rrf2 family transcriptional regulator [Planctomycetes bacterium]|nr:Rrf2 family transcriptional regulator [Planctomycetota bacterium]